MILFDVTLATTADHRGAMVALLDRTMAASQAEAGCVVYRFSADLHDPLVFHLIELWADETAFAGHARGEAFARFRAELPACGRVVSSTARKGALEPYTYKRPE